MNEIKSKKQVCEALEVLTFVDLSCKISGLEVVTLKQIDKYLSKHSRMNKNFAEENYLSAWSICKNSKVFIEQ